MAPCVCPSPNLAHSPSALMCMSCCLSKMTEMARCPKTLHCIPMAINWVPARHLVPDWWHNSRRACLMEMPGKLFCLLAFVRLWGPGPQSFGVSLTLPQHKEEHAFMCLCVCVSVYMCGQCSLVLLSLTMSTASSLGKLIKLKCLTGNHAKVKEMLCKLLLAPTFLGVRRCLSADVCGLVSGVAERSWNVENWIVTVDFAACISGRKWTFNNSTIWGPGLHFGWQRRARQWALLVSVRFSVFGCCCFFSCFWFLTPCVFCPVSLHSAPTIHGRWKGFLELESTRGVFLLKGSFSSPRLPMIAHRELCDRWGFFLIL